MKSRLDALPDAEQANELEGVLCALDLRSAFDKMLPDEAMCLWSRLGFLGPRFSRARLAACMGYGVRRIEDLESGAVLGMTQLLRIQTFEDELGRNPEAEGEGEDAP